MYRYKVSVVKVVDGDTVDVDIDLGFGMTYKKQRVRKVITTFFDGTIKTQILDSKDVVYYSPIGATKVLVGRPHIAIKL